MQRTSTALLFILCLMWLDLTISKAFYEGQILHYNPINGDFQTYNPLRRMAAGEAPGRDFQPYMGLGITYVTYLPFKLMGSNFAASKFSAQLMHMWLFALGSLVLFKLMRFDWRSTLGLTFLVQIYAYLCTDFLALFQFNWHIAETALPFSQTFSALSRAENSCLGIRVALPFITSTLLLLAYKFKPDLSSNKEAALWGFTAGGQAFWSNDFGFASMAVLSAVYMLFKLPQSQATRANQSVMLGLDHRMTSVGIHFLALVVGFLALFALTTHGYPLRALTYNFGGVAKDQFWYFMLDEEGKVFSLMQYVKAKRIFILAAISASLALGLFFNLLCQKKPNLHDILFFYILATSLAAGLLSTIGGGIMERYFAASLRLMPFAFLWILRHCLNRPAILRQSRWIPLELQKAIRGMTVLICVILGIIFYVIFQPVSILNFKEEVAAKTSGHFFYSKWAGGYLSNSQAKEMEIAKRLKGKKLFSTYATLMDAVAGNFQPSHIDYIIHALGKENRAHYLKSFKESSPDYVITPNELWTLWEVWSRRVNWWFYREMIKQYEPVDQTFYHVIWKKRAQAFDTQKLIQNVSCRISGTELHVADTLPVGNYYIELTVGQKTELKNSGVPVIGSRALLTIDEESSGFNAVEGRQVAVPDIRTYNADYTLSPQVLVLEHKAGSPSTLKLRVSPKDRATLTIHSCKVSGVIDFPFPPVVPKSAAYQNPYAPRKDK